MKRSTWMAAALVLACGMAGLAACNDEDNFDEAADMASLEEMEAEIDALIGDSECKGPKDCRAIAFGAKPCGGPWSYKVFSTSAVDTTELFTLVDNYTKFNATLNDRYGWMSDCVMVELPGIDCLDGHCVAVAPAEAETIE